MNKYDLIYFFCIFFNISDFKKMNTILKPHRLKTGLAANTLYQKYLKIYKYSSIFAS